MIGGVGSPAGRFAPLELDGEFTSVAGQLAVLMLENEETQKQIDRDGLANAREAYSAALSREVEALREQADAARLGAIVSGTLGMASAGLDVWASAASWEAQTLKASEPLPSAGPPASASETCKPLLWQKPAAEGLAQVAQPLSTYVTHNYGSADAKSAQGAREQANWEIEDGRKAIADADAKQDEALDWVSGLIGQDAAVATAILSNQT